MQSWSCRCGTISTATASPTTTTTTATATTTTAATTTASTATTTSTPLFPQDRFRGINDDNKESKNVNNYTGGCASYTHCVPGGTVPGGTKFVSVTHRKQLASSVCLLRFVGICLFVRHCLLGICIPWFWRGFTLVTSIVCAHSD